MELRTKQGLQVLRRVHDFLSKREFTVQVGDLKPPVDVLGAVVDRLAQHGVEQDARDRAARSSTRTKHELARTLRLEYLRPISRLARSIFPNDPALRAAFRMPHRLDPAGLVNAALAMADRVTAHEAAFNDSGFKPDLVERLRQAANAVSAEIVARGQAVAARAASTAGQQQELGRGREVVRLIDAMIAPGLAPHQDQLAEWRSITRFIRAAATRVASVGEGEPTTPEVLNKAA